MSRQAVEPLFAQLLYCSTAYPLTNVLPANRSSSRLHVSHGLETHSENMLFFAVMLLTSIALAHFVGWTLVETLEVDPGHIREVMPTIPVAPLQEGSPGRRWRNAVRRVEGTLLERFSGGVTQMAAAELAAELSEDRRVVAGALERMREEVDCRIRVTRSGKILHDFSADQIAELQKKRARSIPTKLFMFGVAAASNIGAIWPVLTILFLAVASLQAMARHIDGAQWGMYGIGMILVVFGATFAVSWGLHFLMSPFISGPSLGPMGNTESKPNRRAPDTGHHDSGGWWIFFGGDSDGGGGFGGDSDTGGSGAGQAIVAIILIAIVILCLITIYIWLRGLWRAITERNAHLERVSPAFWVRTADVVDSFEKWVPTNDLVGRSLRALRRAFSHRRPVDADLGPRTLARAKRRGGVVSALEIALEEGLDLSEATEVGAELCGIVGGEIIVNEAGELGFTFPDDVLDEIDEHAGLRNPAEDAGEGEFWWQDADRDPENYDHLWAEYVSFDDDNPSTLSRRTSQPFGRLPVNLVGLGWGHIQAIDRLVGGTWIMAITGSYLAMWGPPPSVAPYLTPFDDTIFASLAAVPFVTTLALLAMAYGATCLSGVVHYTANLFASHGVRRDARRAAFHLIDRALEEGRETVDISRLTQSTVQVFETAWPNVPRDVLEKEIRGVLVDLDVSYDLDPGPGEAGKTIDLAPLRQRWKSIEQGGFETVLGEQVAPERTPADDEVVFDTKLEHDHVTALA